MRKLISWEEFLSRFEKHKELFSENELKFFLFSIRKSKVISKCGNQAYYRLEKTEEIQRPVWKKLVDNNLLDDIFPGKKDSVDLLKDIFEKEKISISRKESYRWAIYKRLKLYPRLFDFSHKDIEWVNKKVFIYQRRLDNFLNKKRIKKLTIAGGILFGGMAIFYGGKRLYDSMIDKENK